MFVFKAAVVGAGTMGGEIAQGEEWSHEEGVPWWLLQYDHHAGTQQLV